MDFNFKIIDGVDYFVIFCINYENDKIEIIYNQIIDNSQSYIISNEGKENIDKIYHILMEQYKSNADEILFIN